VSWSYDASPLTSNLDAVRFLVGDTDSADQQLQDEEITYLLTVGGGVRMAAYKAAKALASKYARKIDRGVGDLRISYSQKYRQYLTLAEALRVDMASHVAPVVLSLSASAKDTAGLDTDNVTPFFTRLLQETSRGFDQPTTSSIQGP
jgi:hypothetical protein